MDISDWRKKIDELDCRLVELLNQRAHAAQEIGRLKKELGAPIYEPKREQEIFENVSRLSRGPLKGRQLVQIYERLIDVMRNLQKEEMGVPEQKAGDDGETEFDQEVND
ncbi:MAG TPA: chorismate mutase [Terriglobales bacterium]|nr:chorismate mutase [Terriglobales bacterium]